MKAKNGYNSYPLEYQTRIQGPIKYVSKEDLRLKENKEEINSHDGKFRMTVSFATFISVIAPTITVAFAF